MNKTKNIIFIDKVLLAKIKKPIRGVELFNINLIRDLATMKYNVTLLMHKSWIKYLKENKTEELKNVQLCSCSLSDSALENGIVAIWKQRKEHFDIFLLANVANSLIPTISLAKKMKIADRFVLIAHREPSNRFVKTCNKMQTMTVVSVNDKIANHFLKKNFKEVKTFYGIANADQFYPKPPEEVESREKKTIKFCVLGKLDNAWKGADTAIDAFRKLPFEIQRKCELHLASFTEKPMHREKNIITYDWMNYEDIPSFLRKMDAMIVPSRDEVVMRETFSQAMVQGMLTGLPICCNNLPILTEKIDKGGGFTFVNSDELASYMKQLVEDPQLGRSMGAIARKMAKERYVWNTNHFEELFLQDNTNKTA